LISQRELIGGINTLELLYFYDFPFLYLTKENIMIKKHLLAIATLSSVCILPLAQADDYQEDKFLDDRWYMAPFGTFIKSGGDRNAKDGWGGGLAVGKIIDEHFNVELKGFYQEFGASPSRFTGNSGTWELAGGTADVQYFFTREKFAPYAVLGLGGMNTRVSGRSGNSFIGEAGVGATYELHENFLLRGDVRYRYNNNFNANLRPGGTEEYHDMIVNLGFVVPFGPKPTYVAEAPVPVADCTTLDGDSDGVNDCIDKCPGTMSGSKIDDQGCPIRIELKGVQFHYDSADLTEEAKVVLDEVANSFIAYPQEKDIEVQGHASSEGSSEYNLDLSQRRSEAVVEYLKSKNFPNRLYAKGYGEENPIADNETEEGRAKNRRVELVWMD
jgi:OOP family OmpA-OmpF porin